MILRGANIVCFAKDWDDDPTSNTHVMRGLARENRVLWLNSIGMRTPTIGHGRDLRRIARKLREFLRGPRPVAPNLWVATPLVLPMPHWPLATRLNRAVLRATVGWLRRRLRMASFQLWTFLPNVGEYAGRLGESLLVYYCVDNWRDVHGADGAGLDRLEAELCRRADVVFATSRSLVEKKRRLNAETHLASHGVDHAHFATALARDTPTASELAGMPAPVLGIIGLIDERVDVTLLEIVARRRPDWTIAIVGHVATDVSRLTAHPNVRLLGRQPYARLPSFCRGFSVGLIPFAVNAYTRDINPIKLREYLSAGLPVVSTDLPEVAAYATWCWIAGDADAFVDGVGEALRSDTPAERSARSAAMRTETWDQKVAEIGAVVARVQEARP